MPTDNRQCQVRTLRTLRTVSNERCTRARIRTRLRSDLINQTSAQSAPSAQSRLLMGPHRLNPTRVIRASIFLKWVSPKHT